jgi:hypothetical protein
MARYIENGNAKIAPCNSCDCERSIHEKRSARDDCDRPVWYCRNCGEETRRIVRAFNGKAVPGTGGLLRYDADHNLVIA